jgi:hypothetical protein
VYITHNTGHGSISASDNLDFNKTRPAFYLSNNITSAKDWMLKKCNSLSQETIGAILIFELENDKEFFQK